MLQICLIGHTDYSLKIRSKELSLPFGEINNAKKLHAVLKQNGVLTTEVLDIYELFEIEDQTGERGSLFTEMGRINVVLGSGGIDFITDFDDDLTRTFRKNLLSKMEGSSKNVLFFLTWPGRALSILSTGIQKEFPSIGKEASYIHARHIQETFPLKLFAQEINVLTSESLLGAVNSKSYEIPLNKFMHLPNLAPPEATTLLSRTKKEKEIVREEYIRRIAGENKKDVRFKEDTLIIGCPSRFVRRKNVDMLIYAIMELYKNHPNILLLLKGNMDGEFDKLSLYSEKLYFLLQSAMEQPWCLWDKNPSPYPEVLKDYSCYDICAFLSGAELGSNTIVEMCSLGIPTVLLETSVNPYLYKGMAKFVKPDGFCKGPWIYQQPNLIDLINKLEELIEYPDRRHSLGLRSQKLANQRFGSHQLVKRMTLMAKGAWSFFHQDEEAKEYHRQFGEQLMADIEAYEVIL